METFCQSQGAGMPGSGGRLFERPPIFGYDFNVITLATDFTGGTVNTAWASMKNMASYKFQNDTGLSGLILATSIMNPVASKLVGIFVVVGEATDSIKIDGGVKMPMAHLTWQNSPTSGTPNPTNKTSSLSFGENAAMRINSGQSISIYAAGDNVAQTFGAVLTIFTIALDKK